MSEAEDKSSPRASVRTASHESGEHRRRVDTPNDQIDGLRRTLDELRRPSIAKCRPPSLRERCEDRAARAFRAAVHATGMSNRGVADLLTRASRDRSDGQADKAFDHRMVADYMTGARILPSWVPLTLPREGQIAFLSELARDVADADQDRGQLNVA